MTAETSLSLANEVKNIVGIKEASGSFEQIMQIIKNKPKDFLVISGDDGITLPLIACGVDGVISVVANVYPKDFAEMVRLAMKGQFDKAREIHYKLLDIINLLFVEGSPAGPKSALSEMKICSEFLRLPLYQVSKNTSTKIATFVNNYTL
jgi:4-hydroxy-tetrahydrodipicolinate synthase